MIYSIQKNAKDRIEEYKEDPGLLDPRDKRKLDTYDVAERNKKDEDGNTRLVEDIREEWLRRRFHFRKPGAPLPIIGLDAGASIGIGALVVTIGVAFLTNFIQIPTLDYYISRSNTLEGYLINIDNFGNAPAKRVQVYLNQQGTTFQRFFPNPFLNEHFKSVTAILDESGENMWQKLSEPTRDKTHDNEYGCAYILDLEHFSKFSVGGVRPSSPQTLE